MNLKKMKKITLLLAAGCLLVLAACDPETPVITEWVRDYTANAGENTGARVTVHDAAGIVYTAGVIEEGNRGVLEDSYISAYTSTGETIFETRWDDDAYFGAPASAIIQKIALDGAGNVYAFGIVELDDTDKEHLFMLRLDATGNINLVRQWEGEYSEDLELMIENGRIYLAGSIRSNAANFLVLKALELDGTEIWSDSLEFNSLTVGDMELKSDRIILTAIADSSGLLVAWNLNGQRLWQQSFGDNRSGGYGDSVMDDSLNVYTVFSEIEDSYGDLFVRKFSALGELLWTERYSAGSETFELLGRGDSIGFFQDRIIISTGVIVVIEGQAQALDSTIFSMSATSGALLWERHFDSGLIDLPMDFAVAPNGDSTLLVASAKLTDKSGSAILLRTDPEGKALSDKKLDGFLGYDLFLGPDNLVLVAGMNYNVTNEIATAQVHHLILGD